MSPKQVVRHFGSQSKAARALKCSRAAVSKWMAQDRIPFPTQCVIQHKTEGKLKAT